MENPIVRRATADDLKMLAELSIQTFTDTYAADNTRENMAAHIAHYFGVEQLAAELADPSCIFLVAEIGGATAGYAKLEIGEPPNCVTGPQPIELARIYADKK